MLSVGCILFKIVDQTVSMVILTALKVNPKYWYVCLVWHIVCIIKVLLTVRTVTVRIVSTN